jgi:thiamine transporter
VALWLFVCLRLGGHTFFYPKVREEKKGEKNMSKNTKALCEGAIMVALAQILGFIVLWRMPQGGSINLAMLPLIFFGIRYGAGWGALAGFVSGTLDYIIGNGIAIDWTTILCDYMLAFALLGLGAGLFRGKKFAPYFGTVVGGGLQFLSSYLVGVFVWGRWMPDEFLGLTMTTPWLYSFLYNIIWALPDVIITLIVFALLDRIKPIHRLLYRKDLV